jgi:dTDP-4-dehydrorhamnose reductase
LRILVTGVTGQVGSALRSRLAGFGTIIAADRATLDLTKPGEIAERLDALAPDVIVNPAAHTAVDRAEDERELAFLVNAEAPRRLGRWAADHGVPLLHFSTDYVFDGTGSNPWKETDATGPLSVYGGSKLAGESAIREIGGPHLIARTSWVYAPAGGNFLRTIVRLAKEREELRVVADQVGAPTSAAIISDAVAALFERPEGLKWLFARTDGLVHLAASDTTSFHGFATAIVDGLRAHGMPLKVARVIPITTADYPTKAHRPLNSRLDLSRLSGALGISTPSWSEGLNAALRSMIASP